MSHAAIAIKQKQIWIHGQPTLLFAGEIHYYRLRKAEWQPTLSKLKAAGCNAVATYIPWLCHEFERGIIDLTGETNEHLDLVSFLQLCEENELYIIPRPGPFIMAEMKNEGIPFWVYEQCPHAIPVTWDGKKGTTKTLDYLDPAYLAAVNDWYAAVMPLLASHSIHQGGRVVAIQLDNEVGMLSWVSNAPVLTDNTLRMFEEWCETSFGETVSQRYGSAFNPRSPQETGALRYHADLGNFMRHYTKRYFDVLKEMALSYGCHDLPFLINIHGTEAGRSYSYCIGLSQLYQSFCDDPAYLSGSDHYLGEVDIGNFQDYYLLNAFTDCCNHPNQPLTSLEFEAGDGDYAFNYDRRISPYSLNLKVRMFIAQGNRLINYYLFSGGENYRLPTKLHDGNDRVAFTGEKHGFSAPLSYRGTPSSQYEMLSEVTTTMMTNAPTLATMQEHSDHLVFGFIPDYYMTEYCYPHSERERTMIEEIRQIRNGGAFNVLAKSLLLTSHSFRGLNLQSADLLSLSQGTVLALFTTRYLAKNLQEQLVAFLEQGGQVFLYGELPLYDMVGEPCTTLCDYLGVSDLTTVTTQQFPHLSVVPCRFAADAPEVTSGYAQTMQVAEAEIFLRVYETDAPCGFIKACGPHQQGTIVCLTAQYHTNLAVMQQLFQRLSLQKRFSHTFSFGGVFLTASENSRGEQFLHLLNLDDRPKVGDLLENGVPRFTQLSLDRKGGLMLPHNVWALPDVCVLSSTAEIFRKTDDTITFRLTQPVDHIKLKTDKRVTASCDDNFFTDQIVVTPTENGVSISVQSQLLPNHLITLAFA